MGYCYNSFIDLFLFITSCLLYVNKKNTRNELIIVRALRYLRPSQLKAAENSAKCCGANIPKGRGTFDGETYRPVVKLVSTNIYNAQLSRMPHCAPVARKPIIMSWVHAWSCCRWYPRRVSVLEGYSRHEAPRERNFCHRMCCMCVEQHTICR